MKVPVQILLLLISLFAGGLSFPTTGKAANDELWVLSEDYPPLNYLDGKRLRGASAEVVQAILTKLKLNAEIKVYPWSRSYRLAETRKNTALFSMTRSKTREKLFKWVGPLAEKKIGLFAKRGSKIKLTRLSDAQKLLIGVQRDGHGMQYLKARGFKNFDAATNPMANLKKLLGGRNDFWFSSNATVAGNTKRLGIDMNELELALEVDNTFMYIAFNKQTPDTTVRQWQDAFDALVAAGTVKRLFSESGLADLYPTQF